MNSKNLIPKDKINEFCMRNKIRTLALFGSVLRDDFGPESDIDVLIDFEPSAQVGFFELLIWKTNCHYFLVGGKLKSLHQIF